MSKALNNVAKLRGLVDVTEPRFGADPTGSANSTAAFTAAAAAVTGTQRAFVPPGTYAITGTVTGQFYSTGGVTISGGTVDTIFDYGEALGDDGQQKVPSEDQTSGVAWVDRDIYENLIINGGMQIDQRREGSSVTVNTHTTGVLDRWGAAAQAAGKYSVQRVSAPTGWGAFGATEALKATVASAYTAGAGEEFGVYQQIMGYRAKRLMFGSAAARSVAIGFVVQSSVTGKFSGRIKNNASNRSYVFNYTINAANTPEYKSVVIPGDITGTWVTDHGIGLQLYFDLGGGSNYEAVAGSWQAGDYNRTSDSVSWLETAAATWYLGCVRLVPGAVVPTNWWAVERNFEEEMRLCEFYYRKSFARGTAPAQGVGTTTGEFGMVVEANGAFGTSLFLESQMRTTITLTTYNPVSANANWRDVTAGADRTFTGAALGARGIGLYGSGGVATGDTRIHFTLDSDYYA